MKINGYIFVIFISLFFFMSFLLIGTASMPPDYLTNHPTYVLIYVMYPIFNFLIILLFIDIIFAISIAFYRYIKLNPESLNFKNTLTLLKPLLIIFTVFAIFIGFNILIDQTSHGGWIDLSGAFTPYLLSILVLYSIPLLFLSALSIIVYHLLRRRNLFLNIFLIAIAILILLFITIFTHSYSTCYNHIAFQCEQKKISLTNNIDVCANTGDQELYCYEQIAARTGNESLCLKIINMSYNAGMSCYADLAYYYKDFKYCDMIGDYISNPSDPVNKVYVRDRCYAYLFIYFNVTRDEAFCNGLKGMYERAPEACFEALNKKE